jgi:hypothetical protein
VFRAGFFECLAARSDAPFELSRPAALAKEGFFYPNLVATQQIQQEASSSFNTA